VTAIRSREAEARIVKSSKSMEIIQQSDVMEDLHSKVEQASNYYSPVDKSQILKGPNILVQTDSVSAFVTAI
jgi:RNA binding exosome subunit